ncbi:MAG: pectate lyase [Paludibacteraceae bacterium]|nr:pectate lyase [Paludibacteraceae bacterium]
MKKIAFAVAALVSMSVFAQKAVHIYKKDGTKVEYQVADLDSIVFVKADTEPVNPVNPTDPVEQGEGTTSGEVVTKGDVAISKSAGWFESGYVEWTPTNGATGYNVYYKATDVNSYTKADAMLVRDYGSYFRADVVGLPAGSYDIKVVAVKGNAESGAASVAQIKTKAYSRQGFAFAPSSVTGGKGIGAYNDNGSLKSGAVVLYLTEKNKKTVTMDVVTSTKGTTTACTGISAILKAMQKGLETRPVCIRIIGRVTIDGINESGDTNNLLLKASNESSPIQNITIEGIGNDATCYGWGIRGLRTRSIEVRNLGLMLWGDDGLAFETANYNIWIHHNDIFYGAEGSDADQVKGDGSMDLKNDSKYMTISYNHFFDSGKMSLCGMKSETGPNYISYDHNWFDHSDSRHPRIRTMSVHVWNNYYDGVSKYGVGVTYGASAFVEANYFRNCDKPMLSSKQGTDALGEGSFSGENGGIIKSYNNVFAEKSGKFSYITYQINKTSFDAYEAASRDKQVPSSIKTVAGGTPYDNFDTNNSLMYTYKADDPANVPAIVTANAGRIDGGDLKWKFNNSTDDASYSINTQLKNAINGYTSKLVSVLGE